jgi:hypothetical protein
MKRRREAEVQVKTGTSVGHTAHALPVRRAI